MSGRVTRRRFFQGAAAAGLLWALPERLYPAPFHVSFPKPNPYESLLAFLEPGHDEFTVEKRAMEITAHLERLVETRSLPLGNGFEGASPLPARYKTVAEGVLRAEFDPADRNFQAGLEKWLKSLGEIRRAQFFVLTGDRVRYEIASSGPDGLRYRVGLWKQSWVDGRLSRFEPLEETVTTSPRPLFEDVTASLFGAADSFEQQMLRGVPYWRARLDAASGMDVYGHNGIAVGDIDGDGVDEVYVCQPGGLPNRLYKNRDGVMQDITERAGVGVLDDTASALFVDFRNSGRQDLVLLTKREPQLFLNQGEGVFRHKADAFRFATVPQGTFTGMAAADYDLDGRVDLYLCTYAYFVSENQYLYAVPYHDSQNGPPNFLFHNRLTTDGEGFFEDVTAQTGLRENNNRYSFAAAWCDANGDGSPDLYVANDFGRNNFYRNQGGTFRDDAEAAGVSDMGPGMSAAWFDYDGDGHPDLYTSNMWTASGERVVQDPAFSLASSDGLREAYRRHTKGNSLYRNRGDGTFEETGAAEGVEMGRWAWAAGGFDFDNDGAPEIYCTCGMLTNSSAQDLMSFFWRQVVARSPATKTAAPAYENGWNAINQLIREDYSWNGREPNVVYARRNGHFYDWSGVSGLDCAEDSRAFAATDFDGDGNLDVFLKNRLGPQVRAFRNQWGTGRNAIAIELRGVRSNRDGIGARVEVTYSGGRSVQFLQAGSGYLSQHTKRLHFGLGDAPTTGLVRVRWPSGQVQEFGELRAGFRYAITEGENEYRATPFLRRKTVSDSQAAVVADNQPRFEPTWLLEPTALPEPWKGPGFLCLVAGQTVAPRPGLRVETVDLAAAGQRAGYYALLRRYLFDYRADFALPFTLLVDERGLAHKLYPDIPEADTMRRDLQLLRQDDRLALALPFAGQYYAPPRRNDFQMGAAFYWVGYPEQALIYFNEVVRKSPDNAKVYLAIGQIHLEAGRRELAREPLERAVKLNPEAADGWMTLGSLEVAEENYAAGLGDFQKALAILPDAPFALLGAGRAYGKLGDPKTAESMFRRALQVNQRDAEAANELGLLLAAQNRVEEARTYFQQAIAAQKNHAGAINNLGVVYMQMQKPQEALAAFRYGIQVAPEDETLYLNLARVYVRLGDRTRARDVLQQLLEHKPDSAAGKEALEALRRL